MLHGYSVDLHIRSQRVPGTVNAVGSRAFEGTGGIVTEEELEGLDRFRVILQNLQGHLLGGSKGSQSPDDKSRGELHLLLVLKLKQLIQRGKMTNKSLLGDRPKRQR